MNHEPSDPYVEISFSGPNHYTSADIVVLEEMPNIFQYHIMVQKVVESTLDPGSFKRGVISGQSDILMIKGPPVYIQFLDLTTFSHL